GERAGLRRVSQHQYRRGDGRHDHRLARIRSRRHDDVERRQHGRKGFEHWQMSIAPMKIGSIESVPNLEKKPEADLASSFTKALDEARALDQDATKKA